MLLRSPALPPTPQTLKLTKQNIDNRTESNHMLTEAWKGLRGGGSPQHPVVYSPPPPLPISNGKVFIYPYPTRGYILPK